MGKGEATRVAVLDEATRLASQVGLGGLTIGSLATQTGLSKSGLFAHFRAKESLQVQVLEHAAAQFRDFVIVPALAAPRGEPRLRELFDRWLDWIGNGLPGGCLFISASYEFDDQPGPVRDVLSPTSATGSRPSRASSVAPSTRGTSPPTPTPPSSPRTCTASHSRTA